MIIGLDIGYGTTKLIDSNGRVCSFKSIVGVGEPQKINLLGGEDKGYIRVVKVGGNTYTVGEDAEKYNLPIVDVKQRNSIESLAFKALVLAAIGDSVNSAPDLKIITGLPVKFHDDASILIKSINDVVSAEVGVVPQPAGSFFDLFLDNKGNVAWHELNNSRVGIIDIGTYTTDILLVDSLNIVEALSGTVTVGLHRLTSSIINACKTEGIRQSLTHVEAEKAFESGTVKKYGKEIDISSIVQVQKDNITKDIWSYVNSMWGKDERIDYIVLTGGGASVFCDSFPKFKTAELTTTSNAFMANVYGFYKLGRRIYERDS